MYLGVAFKKETSSAGFVFKENSSLGYFISSDGYLINYNEKKKEFYEKL